MEVHCHVVCLVHAALLTKGAGGSGVAHRVHEPLDFLARDVKAGHLTGAQLIGPAGSSEQVSITFRYPGTPTFVAIDRNGRVVRTLPGYPIPDEMKHWYAVMVGDQDVP